MTKLFNAVNCTLATSCNARSIVRGRTLNCV